MAEVRYPSKLSDEEIERVSAIISNSMFYTMASTSKTEAKRNEMLMAEFLYYSRYKRTVQRFFGGSAAEGTSLSSSDIDKMIVGPNIFVCSSLLEIVNVRGHTFLLDTKESSQGYAKLVLLFTNASIPTIFDDHGYTLNDMLEQNEDGQFLLSSEKIVMFWMNFLRKRQTATGPPTTSRHGPSATARNTDLHGHIKNEVGGIIEQDFVQGLPFCHTPIEGETWLRDRARFHWPSLKTIEKIKALGCHVVAVGDKMSKHCSVEWRVSFLLWERELVWSFNDIQLQCYVLLKALLKKHIIINLENNTDPNGFDELSSYHMKNIVFWESEETEENCWRKEYLITFLKRCLLFFRKCILRETLQHFIDRKKNLLLGKLQDPNIKEEILKRLEDIIQNLHVYCLECVDGIHLAKTWNNSYENVKNFIAMCKERHGARVTSDFDDYRPTVKLYYDGQASFLTNVENLAASFSTLSQYHVSFEDSNGTLEVNEGYKRSVEMFIYMRCGLILTNEMIASNSDVNADEKYQKLVVFMDKNADIDALSGKLYVVTAILAFSESVEALKRINEIFTSVENKVYLYTGLCSDCKTLQISEQTCSQEKGLPKYVDDSSPRELLMMHDIMFADEDISIVPGALKFECFIDRAFSLHPVVYLFYLRVLLGGAREKSENIERLCKVVLQCSGTLHSYRHLNILGYCYFGNGCYEWAFNCYLMSISQTCDAGRPNAAFFLLLVLLYKIIQT